MAQSVKYLTLGFGSGHVLTVCGIKPCIGLGTDSTWNSLSPSLSALPSLVCVCGLSLKINKLKKIKNSDVAFQMKGLKGTREKIPSRLRAISTEFHAGLELTNHEIMT